MATSEPTRGRPRADTARVKARILEAFSEKAKRQGIRSVVMGELASELKMSASTLYKQFPSKDGVNRIMRNDNGEFALVELAEIPADTLSVLFSDFNQDGHLDLYVTNFGANFNL